VAREGRGGRRRPEGVPLDKEEHAAPGEGHGAHAQGGGEAEDGGAVEWPVDVAEHVRLEITARRVRIDPAKKKRSYIRRLERVMRLCDRLASNPEGYEEIQVKAMAVLVRAIQVCYGIVVDVAVEQLEEDVERLTARYRELAEAGGPDREDPEGD